MNAVIIRKRKASRGRIADTLQYIFVGRLSTKRAVSLAQDVLDGKRVEMLVNEYRVSKRLCIEVRPLLSVKDDVQDVSKDPLFEAYSCVFNVRESIEDARVRKILRRLMIHVARVNRKIAGLMAQTE